MQIVRYIATMNINRILLSVVLLLFVSVTYGYSQEKGIASYYSDVFNGHKMANGDIYDPDDLICAHLNYPLGSILKVARKDDPDKSVMVIVTDRGPYIDGRIIDLSKRAAEELGILDHGITEVVVALIKKPRT